MDVEMFRCMYAWVDAGLYSMHAHKQATKHDFHHLHGQHSVQVSVQPLSQCSTLAYIIVCGTLFPQGV